MRHTKAIGLLAAMILGVPNGQAQQLKGAIHDQQAAGDTLRLLQARGSDFVAYDSTKVRPDGTFDFKRTYDRTGMYRLARNDSDFVDLVLDAREQLVELEFAALPMQAHINVKRSRENQRLQDLLYVTQETNAILGEVAEQKALLQHTDTLQLNSLDRIKQQAALTQAEFMENLAAEADSSYFAALSVVNKALDLARGESPDEVVQVFNFSDPKWLRSTVYDKAVMTFLRNMVAVSESQFIVAADTLMHLAGGDRDCKAYMLEHLIGLFATYGPEMALQHMIDRYATSPAFTAWLSPEVKQKVEALQRVSVGHTGPEVELNDHGTIRLLSQVAAANRYTALFFYSSTCGHCQEQMPLMKEDYRRYHDRGFEVVGIALDADSAEFLESLRSNAIPWQSYSEFVAWGSQAAKDYQVQATPTIILLDRRMRIVAKPADAEELAELLAELVR